MSHCEASILSGCRSPKDTRSRLELMGADEERLPARSACCLRCASRVTFVRPIASPFNTTKAGSSSKRASHSSQSGCPLMDEDGRLVLVPQVSFRPYPPGGARLGVLDPVHTGSDAFASVTKLDRQAVGRGDCGDPRHGFNGNARNTGARGALHTPVARRFRRELWLLGERVPRSPRAPTCR